MYFSYFNLLFLFTLIFGSFLSISSSFWFSVWAGLELNLISFIPLIISKKSKYSSEAALKYFLIQALGSAMIIFSSSMLLFSFTVFSLMLTMALLLKVGAAPFYFWFPQVMEGMDWPQATILMTIQKLAPLYLLSYLMSSSNIVLLLFIASALSAAIGAIGGLNQISLRKILSFSSINHLGWMLSAIVISESMFLFYFGFYCFISISITMLFFVNQSFFLSQLSNQDNTPSIKVVSILTMLSLGGLPPFAGFIPKWFLIQELCTAKSFFILMILILSALVTLYFYLRVGFSTLMISSLKVKPSFKKNLSPSLKHSPMIFFNFWSLLIPSCVILI